MGAAGGRAGQAAMQEASTAAPSISWDSHTYVSDAPESLVREDDLEGANMEMRRKFEANCRRAQNAICAAIQELDGASFREDVWTREGGGGGISRVLSEGNVFEKAGCSLSVVYGSMPQEALASATTRGADRAKGYAPGERVPFFACGLSSVMHPRNPMAPTMHFNYRYFETEGGVWWFGGGTDLTPSYLFEEDVKQFHGEYKKVCDKHDPEYYAKFKKWADEYFYIKHRGETRGLGGMNARALTRRPSTPLPGDHARTAGIASCDHALRLHARSALACCQSTVHPHPNPHPHPHSTRTPHILPGIFFDDQNDRDRDTIFAFSQECLDTVIPAYLPLVVSPSRSLTLNPSPNASPNPNPNSIVPAYSPLVARPTWPPALHARCSCSFALHRARDDDPNPNHRPSPGQTQGR